MIAIIPAFAALLCLIALIGISTFCVLPHDEKRKAVTNCGLLFVVFTAAAVHLYVRSLPEPAPTINKTFNQLP